MGLRWDARPPRRERRHIDSALSWLLAGALLVIVSPLIVVWVTR